ncbi:hypothetical protein LAZ67_14002709 [Cordylochernes scorpioides]|uniref:Uncharacterized protein n=1 Tax=Cordylochernes scorpioides TaxID=51811 RepID=A0ABY6L757_9ARAC|nr:hypothetical protein LAZ67_14002709 [Cordylochernes scorpioides]
MEALKKMRSPLRGLITKKQLKRLEQKVEALNGRIGNLLIEEDASEDLFLADAEGCNAYECMLATIEVKVQEALESIAAVQQERKGSTSASMEKKNLQIAQVETFKVQRDSEGMVAMVGAI